MKQQSTYITNAIKNLKIESLNAMQEASVEAYQTGKDLILLSPTGSGKTLAYLLPLLSSLKPGVNGVQVIVLVPSRELALQIDQVFKSMNTGFQCMSCYGGRPAMEEHRTMKGIQPSLIIATPGRMNDHLSKNNFNPNTVTTLVIDEFDKCLEFGFQEEMATIIQQLPSLNRRLLISATDAAEIPLFAGVDKSVKLDFLHTKEELENRLQLFCVQSPSRDKLDTLYQLLCTLGNESTLVFCNHRESVDRVGAFLQSMKLPCGMFHGGMEQDARERSLYKFRNGSCYVLVSTDLAARGLDIADVQHVIHYHIPANKEGYIHRNGRTARWEADGNAYIILHGEEQLPDYVSEEVETFTFPEVASKPQLPNYVTWYIGKGKKEKVNKIDIVGFLSKKGQLGKEDIGRIDVKEHYAFVAVSRKKSKQALSLVRNEKIKGLKTVIEEAK